MLTIVPGYLSSFSVAEHPEYRVIGQHRCSNPIYVVLRYELVNGEKQRVEVGETQKRDKNEALAVIEADLKARNLR